MPGEENRELDYLDRMIDERRDKAKAMRAAGVNPYASGWKPDSTTAAIREGYEKTKPTEPPPGRPGPDGDRKRGEARPAPPGEGTAGPSRRITPVDDHMYRIAGRVMSKRGFGKTVFADLQDAAGRLQLFVNIDHCEGFAEKSPWIDVGDFVGVEGQVFWTKTGELSLLVKKLDLLTKSLRPLPEKFHGLSDVETRYRQRYVDMVVNADVRETFKKRSQIVRGLRRFLDERNFIEVETPMMHSVIGGAAAKPFRTHHNALDLDLYMRIAPELYLKRLVVGGFERVYEIGRNFRNEGLSRQHNPEFTMLEFYMAYATYQDLMRLTEEMFCAIAKDVTGGTKVEYDGQTIDLAPPWKRVSVKEAVVDIAGKSAELFEDPELAAQVAREVGVNGEDVKRALHGVASLSAEEKRVRAGQLGMAIFEATAEKSLIQPTFLTDFPLAVSPLARRKDSDPAFCDRFELYIAGREMANAFSELNDPDDQRSRFQAQMDAKAAGADETMDYDEDYCRALEIGMPPTAGEGIGVDRFAMLLTGAPSIRDVILFPLMRRE
jgi:lysyl-tRNA synthetase class 2